MNTLVLLPNQRGLRFATMESNGQRVGGEYISASGTVAKLGDVRAALVALGQPSRVDLVAIRALYGGEEFPSPIIADSAARERLLGLGAQAPLCVGQTVDCMNAASAAFPGTPVALAFETSFFVDLPVRETTYALPPEMSESVRRWGFHGLFHDAATSELGHRLRKTGLDSPARILSVCLESRPEIAAVFGRKPLLVTSGHKPAEGLPGETNAGEIDPAIALAIAADPAYGPEGANAILTSKSGIHGMVGRKCSLAAVLESTKSRLARARSIILYRMLLAAGSAAAALEGLDGIVFSGRYASSAPVVARYLVPRLELALALPEGSLPWVIHDVPLESLVAEATLPMLYDRN
jgi:acetate kinase